MEEEWREKLIDKIAATNDDLIEKVFDCRLKVGVLPPTSMPFVLPQSAA